MDEKKILDLIYRLRNRIKNDSRYYINGNRPAVCSDDTLCLIAKYAPTSMEELKNIKGVGDTFIEKYGSLFVNEIKKYTDTGKVNLDPKQLELLNKLENRLVDINKRNRLLYAGKINKDFGIDIFKYLKKPEEFINFILEQKTSKYELIDITNIDDEKIKGLLKLIRQVNRIETETGNNELYLAYPFLQGKFENEDFSVKAPLLLFPVRLERTTDNITILNDTSRDIIYNTTLILANNKFNGKNKVLPDSDISEFEKDTYLDSMLKFYADNELYITKNNFECEKFFENKKSEFPKYKNGEFELKGYMVLGLYSMSVTPLYADFHKMIENKDITNLIEELLEGIDQPLDSVFDTDYEEQTIRKNDLEEKISYINSLDYSQEKVLEAIKEKEAIVVQGPPGTGKSQTITNIIVEAIQSDKKVLMVSEKKTALDVIYSRLGNLSDFAMIVDDVENKNEFYAQLIKIFNSFGEKKASSQNNDIYLKSAVDKIESNLDALDKIGEKIYGPNQFGISIYDLYQKCKKLDINNNTDSVIYSYLKDNMYDKLEFNTSYNDLFNTKEKLDNEVLLNQVYDYCLIADDNNNNYLTNIKDNLNDIDISTFKNNINELIELKSTYDSYNFVKKFFFKKNIVNSINNIIQNYFNYSDKNEYKSLFENILKNTDSVREFIEKYNDYENNKFVYNKLTDLEQDYFADIKDFHINCNEHGSLSEDNQTLFNYILNSHILNFEKNNSDLKQYIDNFDSIIKEINENINKKKEILKESSYKKLYENFRNIGVNGRVNKIIDLCNRSRKMSVNKFAQTYSLELFDSINIWLMTPEVVAELLPFKKDLFDIVIFDEASQLYVERSMPAIYRGKKIVVAGDQKQLRPSSLGKGRILDDVSDEDMVESTNDFLGYESLLDAANYKYYRTMLNYHYRSKYEELINFSNYAFYHGRLMITTNAAATVDVPIERIKVKNGRWIDKKNDEEAKETVKLVKKILTGRKNNETVGVITFNVSQMYLIDDYLEKEKAKDTKFNELISAEEKRTEDGQNIGFFVKNIETVQGDERDIIIFCIGYAKNESDRVAINFGWLNQDGGENRLNVAISRAKEKIYVITSIEPDELHVEDTKNNGPKLFKKYLEYSKYVSEGKSDQVKLLLNNLIDSSDNSESNIRFDSVFEEEVFNRLTELGYDVTTQYGVGGYSIDMVVRDKEKNNILGIECDGRLYHSSKSARERDYHRQKYLESRGWTIYRIWSSNWWNNPEAEIKKVDKYLKTIMKKSEKANNK